MPTNKVKHQMIRLAKSIANLEFAMEINRDTMINKTLFNHPEFDTNEFKKMVKDFRERLHNKGFEE